MSDEMEKALQADGEKLRNLTGEEHGPLCPECLGEGWLPTNVCCGNPTPSGECCALPVTGQEGCDACQGTGKMFAAPTQPAPTMTDEDLAF